MNMSDKRERERIERTKANERKKVIKTFVFARVMEILPRIRRTQSTSLSFRWRTAADAL